MSYVDIGIKLYDVVRVNTGLAATFNYDPKTYDKFPTASISAGTTPEVILDTCTNMSDTSYIVRVVDQNKSVETMENRMRELCDSLMSDLRSTTLDNTIQRLLMNVKWGWTEDEHPMRVFEIECVCLNLKRI